VLNQAPSSFASKSRLPGARHLAGYALRKGYSLRAYIVAGVAVTLIPLLLLGFWLIARVAASERSLLEQQADRELQGISTLVDHEIAVAKSVLVALASSQFLKTDDLKSFRGQAMRVARQLGTQVVLRDPQRQLVVINTALTEVAPVPLRELPPELAVAEAQTLETGDFVVSNLFFAPLLKRHTIAVTVPVSRDNDEPYILSIGIPASRFAELISQTQFPSDLVATLIDENNVVIARSKKHDDFVGVKLRADFTKGMTVSAGIDRSVNREGIAHQWHWRRIETTKWSLSVGIPEATLNQPLRFWMAGYGIGAGVFLVVALWLANHFGSRLAQSSGTLGVDRAPTQEEFRVLFDSASTGVVVVNGAGIMVLANACMGAQFGYSPGELMGRPLEILVPARNRESHAGLRQQYSRSPSPREMGAGRELYGLRKDGSEFPIEIGLNPIATFDGKLTMATVVDITARKQAEAELSKTVAERDRLRRRIIQALEDERLRLAHDLHDETGQTLAAALLELKNIEPAITGDGAERLRPLREQLHRIGKDIHRVAWHLRPASIDELGLQAALADHISEWSAQTGIAADFHCQDGAFDEIAEEVRTTIYRVVQEALTNIAKHANLVTAVSILINRADGALRVTIGDDGCGFEAERTVGIPRAGNGIGIAGMRERLSLIGGELEIESSSDGGTTVFARIPLQRERATA